MRTYRVRGRAVTFAGDIIDIDTTVRATSTGEAQRLVLTVKNAQKWVDWPDVDIVG